MTLRESSIRATAFAQHDPEDGIGRKGGAIDSTSQDVCKSRYEAATARLAGTEELLFILLVRIGGRTFVVGAPPLDTLLDENASRGPRGNVAWGGMGMPVCSRGKIVLLGLAALCALAGSASAGLPTTDPEQPFFSRGDADCSSRISVVDLIATVAGFGSASECANEDCDRDGVLTDHDLICVAGCLFGECPLAPGAPEVSQVLPDSTGAIAPFSAVRILGDFGQEGPVVRVTIGGVEAEIVDETDDGELVVIVPDLPPGPADLVVYNGEIAGRRAPVTVAQAVPIGEPDTFESTLDLIEDALDRFAALPLEEEYSEDDATLLRDEIASALAELASLRDDLDADPSFDAEARARLDAAFDSSGVPELLRASIAEIDAIATTGSGAGPATRAVRAAANLGRTIKIVRGVAVVGGASLSGPALIALVLGITGGVLVTAAQSATPLLVGLRFLDANFDSRAFPTQGGYAQFKVRRTVSDQVALVIRMRGYDAAVVAEGSSGGDFQIQLPREGGSFCGKVEFFAFDMISRLRSQTIRTNVQPQLTGVSPTTVKPGSGISFTGHALRCSGSSTFAIFAGPTPDQADFCTNCVSHDVLTPNVEPGNYTTSVAVDGLRSREQLPLTIETAITGVEVTCSSATIGIPPGSLSSEWPISGTCTATPLPRDIVLPPGTTYVWRSSDSATATVTAVEGNRGSATVEGSIPGTTNIAADVVAGSRVLASSNAFALTVVDEVFPSAMLTTSSPLTVAPGGQILLRVTAIDNFIVSSINLRAIGEAAVEFDQGFPCFQLEATCSADFTVNVKQDGFTQRQIVVVAEVSDGSGNHSNSFPLTFTVGDDDTRCPQVTISNPIDRSTVSAGATVAVHAIAVDNGANDTGVKRFVYSATGDALVAPVAQELPLPQPLPQSSLDFSFQVKDAAALAGVTNRTVAILVRAVDAADNACEQSISVAVVGSGDVQVTLVWSDTNDLDLAVTDPTGFTISYINRTSPSGGMLDVDANPGCGSATTTPTENVFWPAGAAPAGQYSVRVSYFAGCTEPTVSSTYTVTITVDGTQLIPITRSIGSGSHDVTTFTR